VADGIGRDLEPGEYGLAEVLVGDRYRTGGVSITEAHVVAYAGVSGDHYDIHMDDRAAQKMGFSHRIGHGLLGLALTDGLKVRAPVRFGLSRRWVGTGNSVRHCLSVIGSMLKSKLRIFVPPKTLTGAF
jgi:acyl dehydratase